MKNCLTFFFLLLTLAGTAQIFPLYESKENFDIILKLEKADNNDYYLVADLVLRNNSYVISPYSEDDTYLHFSLVISENENIKTEDELLEIPPSTEEYDPILEEQVKFVRVNTIYKQRLKINAKEDFKATGLIEFLLEPSCIPYDVTFVLSNKSGKLSVLNVETLISAEYK